MSRVRGLIAAAAISCASAQLERRAERERSITCYAEAFSVWVDVRAREANSAPGPERSALKSALMEMEALWTAAERAYEAAESVGDEEGAERMIGAARAILVDSGAIMGARCLP